MRGHIHHIEWCVSDLKKLSDQLANQFAFRKISGRHVQTEDGSVVEQVVLQSGLTVFILTQKKSLNTAAEESSDGPNSHEQHNHRANGHSSPEIEPDSIYPTLTCCSASHKIDSVFNVCLEVSDVDRVTENILRANGQNPRAQASVIIPPKSIQVKSTNSSADDCSIRYAVVQSPCGNVIHTLINTDQYRRLQKRPFLPGFVDTPQAEKEDEELEQLSTTHMDHVTYVCRTNQSHDILKWYKTCFGMQPFQITNNAADVEALKQNDDEATPEAAAKKEKAQFNMASIDIGEEVGMKMTVGEWITSWMCREEGVEFPPADADNVLNFKLVLAEPLEEESDSHVQHFLDSHGGPGLQHIGLTSPNVSETVEWMYRRGAQFRTPPPTYYQLEHKQKEIIAAQEDIEKFSKLGLLVDSEADMDAQNGAQDRFLIQIFTRPLFYPTQNTFFLEILERRGARGFGAGNITALAKSIIMQQQQEENNKQLQQQQQQLVAASS